MILAAILLRYEWQDSICGKICGQYYFRLEPNRPVTLCCCGVMKLASRGLSSNEPSLFLASPHTHRMAWRSLDTGHLGICPVAPRACWKAEETAQMLEMAGTANQKTMTFLRA